MNIPKILAPAGDKHSFLAAIAAGADAIYCGLKIFSARMEAENFSVEELAQLTQLAKSYNIDVYLAINSIIKESEIDKVFKILCKLCQYVDLQGLIVQDPALITIAEKAGFGKKFHLSTLGNCTSALSIKTARTLGFNKIVLPREFNIDEMKAVAQTVPEDVELEVFIHGALCYSVSGRCYWSSWFGGKSSLRGRCVQPCRRIYEQKGQKKRHFSCMDFSADILVKILKDIPRITTWKIEGRKKSPHYVYYTVKAYKLLRDHPKQKNQALSYLNYAMGREFGHYNLLSQRIMNPLDHKSETGSGLFAGRIINPAEPYFITREALLPSDLLRIGYEGDAFHDVQRVTRAIPKKGKFYLSKKSKHRIGKGTPVFLIDRREGLLANEINDLEKQLNSIKKVAVQPVEKEFSRPARPGKGKIQNSPSRSKRSKSKILEMNLFRNKGKSPYPANENGVWISGQRYSIAYSKQDWLWIDPLLFPEEELLCAQTIERAIRKGAKNFVLNAPWQISLFNNPSQLNIWAGPFCNITNTVTIDCLKTLGFSGAIVSPELDKETFIALPSKSKLPLGVVIRGNWPLGISRVISPDLKIGLPFSSPMGETAWVSKFNNNYHIFPNWMLDLTENQDELTNAGYSMFINIHETIPRSVAMKKRPGLWNWNLNLI
ncbi:MAG: peptidase U32 family protein [Pseudomonadota bacterium]